MARSYEASITDFSGGMSPAVSAEFAREDELRSAEGFIFEGGRLLAHPGTEVVPFNQFGIGVKDFTVRSAVRRDDGSIVWALVDDATGDLGFYYSSKFDYQFGEYIVRVVPIHADSAEYIHAYWNVTSVRDNSEIFMYSQGGYTVVVSDAYETPKPLAISSDNECHLLDRLAEPDYETMDVYEYVDSTRLGLIASGVTTSTMTIPWDTNQRYQYFAFSRPVSALRITRISTFTDSHEVALYVRYYDGGDTIWPGTEYIDGNTIDVRVDNDPHVHYFRQPAFLYQPWQYGAGARDSDSGLLKQTDYVLQLQLYIRTGNVAEDDEYEIQFFFNEFEYASQEMNPTFGLFHNQRLWLGSMSVINSSAYNNPLSWSTQDIEIFEDGGHRINALCSFRGNLFVFKDRATYVISGTSYLSYKKDVIFDIGARDAIEAGDALWFVNNGTLYVTDGRSYSKASSHVFAEEDTGLVGKLVEVGRYVYSNDYLFDPLTREADPRFPGGVRVAFFRWSGQSFPWIGLESDAFVVNTNGKLEHWSRDLVTRNGVSQNRRILTHFLILGSGGVKKQIERVKIVLGIAGRWSIYFYPDLGRYTIVSPDPETVSTNFDSGTPTADGGAAQAVVYETTLPYRLDGRNLSIGIRTTTDDANAHISVHSIHLAFRRRKF